MCAWKKGRIKQKCRLRREHTVSGAACMRYGSLLRKLIEFGYLAAALQLVVFQHGIIMDSGQQDAFLRRDEDAVSRHEAHI